MAMHQHANQQQLNAAEPSNTSPAATDSQLHLLLAAIAVLYSDPSVTAHYQLPPSTSFHNNINAANSYLLQFQQSSQAWQTSVQHLLASPILTVQLVGIQTLGHKVKLQLHELPAAHQLELLQTLLNCFEQHCTSPTPATGDAQTYAASISTLYSHAICRIAIGSNKLTTVLNRLQAYSRDAQRYRLALWLMSGLSLCRMNDAHDNTMINDQLELAIQHIQSAIPQLLTALQICISTVSGGTDQTLWLEAVCSVAECGAALGQFYEYQILHYLLQWLAHALHHRAEPANEVIIERLCETLSTIVALEQYPVEAHNTEAIALIVEACNKTIAPLVQQLSSHTDDSSIRICTALCTFISGTLTAKALQFALADAPAEYRQLYATLLHFTRHPVRSISEITLDAYYAVNDIEVAERHASLRADTLFTELVHILVQQCVYPPDFPASGSFDDYDNQGDAGFHDADQFQRYREQCEYVLSLAWWQQQAISPLHYHQLVEHLELDGVSDWRADEVRLFAWQCTMHSDEDLSDAVQLYMQNVIEHLILSTPPPHPSFLSTACQLLKHYVPDLLHDNSSALHSVLSYLLCHCTATSEASIALCTICSDAACQKTLASDATAINQILQQCMSMFVQWPMPIRKSVVSSLAAIAGRITPPQAAVQIIHTMFQPIIGVLQQQLQSGYPLGLPNTRDTIRDCIVLLSLLLVESTSEEQPVSMSIASALQPMLTTVLQQLASDEDTVAAITQFYANLIATNSGRSLLPVSVTLLEQMLIAYRESSLPACLSVMSQLASIIDKSAGDMTQVEQQLTSTIGQAFNQLRQHTHYDTQQYAEEWTAMYELLHTALLTHRSSVLHSPYNVLPHTIQSVVQALQTATPTKCQTTGIELCIALVELYAADDDDNAMNEHDLQALQLITDEQCSALVKHILYATVSGSPTLLPTLTSALYACMEHLPEGTHWVEQALTSELLPTTQTLSDDQRTAIADIIVGYRKADPNDLLALLTTLGQVLAGKQPLSALQQYTVDAGDVSKSDKVGHHQRMVSASKNNLQGVFDDPDVIYD